ncbi:hypothetical protein PDJAM_G00257470 [Pangasius djambal]|uniref:Uncharacterized protein n=1 Tax=Pangasius djambal TaxID=1691987 RepID=A0ACC5YLC7_9TELE|nr:hypothetical protein [Pangasius djambal]
MKVSRSKTEYMCVNEREGSGTVRLQGEEAKKVQEFKYLGSTVQSNGECGKEVKKRVQAGWNGWRKVSGVLCDRKISARIEGKVNKTVVRAAMLYGLETVALRKRQESELEVAELKMLRFSLGVTRLDRIRNEYIRGTAHVGRLGDKVSEARLRWFGHVQRREREYIGRRMLDMELPGRRRRGRPKRSGTVRLQGEEVKKVQEFKYLGSTVQSNGECEKEVKKRVQAGWNGWRKVSGVLCDRKISARIKGKVYETVVRAARLYGLETVALRKRQEAELEVAELKMLRFSLGVTRLDRIRNEYIRGTAHVGRLGDKVREARLRWFGHVQRRESEYIGRRMLDMELPGRRRRGSQRGGIWR